MWCTSQVWRDVERLVGPVGRDQGCHQPRHPVAAPINAIPVPGGCFILGLGLSIISGCLIMDYGDGIMVVSIISPCDLLVTVFRNFGPSVIFVLGGPGAGKGTQLGAHFSSRRIFRT